MFRVRRVYCQTPRSSTSRGCGSCRRGLRRVAALSVVLYGRAQQTKHLPQTPRQRDPRRRCASIPPPAYRQGSTSARYRNTALRQCQQRRCHLASVAENKQCTITEIRNVAILSVMSQWLKLHTAYIELSFHLHIYGWRGGAMHGRATHLRLTGSGFESCLGSVVLWPWSSYLHLCARVTKQYNLFFYRSKARICDFLLIIIPADVLPRGTVSKLPRHIGHIVTFWQDACVWLARSGEALNSGLPNLTSKTGNIALSCGTQHISIAYTKSFRRGWPSVTDRRTNRQSVTNSVRLTPSGNEEHDNIIRGRLRARTMQLSQRQRATLHVFLARMLCFFSAVCLLFVLPVYLSAKLLRKSLINFHQTCERGKNRLEYWVIWKSCVYGAYRF